MGTSRTTLVRAVLLVAAGFAGVLYFAGLLAWQIAQAVQTGKWLALPVTLVFTDHALPFLPALPWKGHEVLAPLLGKIHFGLPFAIIGLALMALGVLRAMQQAAVKRAVRQDEEDRRRRVRDYRSDDSRVDAVDGRLEPYIGGSGLAANADRRVA
jgi:hypothetical protein